MMNYIATQLVAFYTIVWEMPKGSGKIGIINQKTNIGWLPEIGRIEVSAEHCSGSACDRAHVHLSDSTASMAMRLRSSARVSGQRRYVGIKVEKVIVRTMLLSGAICGLVGLLLVGGINHTVTTTIAQRTGLYCGYGIMDGKVQSVYDDLYELSDHFSESWSE